MVEGDAATGRPYVSRDVKTARSYRDWTIYARTRVQLPAAPLAGPQGNKKRDAGRWGAITDVSSTIKEET